MSQDLTVQEKIELMRNIQPYRGLGRNPNSNIRMAQPYHGLGPNPYSANTTINKRGVNPTTFESSRPFGEGASTESTHPFKIVPEGDDKVTVKTGAIKWWDIPYHNGTDSDMKFPIYGRALVVNEVNEIEVGGNSGGIYLICPMISRQITEDYKGSTEIAPSATFHLVPHGSTAPSIIFSATEPEDSATVGEGNLIILIGYVAKSDGVASVTNQILKENVQVSIQREYWGS